MISFFRKLGWLRRRAKKEADLQDELTFHLSEEAEARAADGVGAEKARLAARRELGNLALVQEETRAAWSWTLVEHLAQDVRYAWRTMAANKTFSALAILSLALGIGANTAIFSFMDSILMRNLPVRDPGSLVMLNWHTPDRDMHGTNRHDNSYDDPHGGFVGGFFAHSALEMFRGNSALFSSVFGYQGAGVFNLTFQGQADLARTEYVTGDYFSALGVPPAAGRLFGPEDDRANAPAVAIISYALSQRRFGGPANAPGQAVLINNLPFTVIGVAPPEFYGVDPDQAPAIYVPLHANLLFDAGNPNDPPARAYTDPDYDWVIVMARLRPGVSPAQAQAALAPQFAQWEQETHSTQRLEERPKLLVREGSGGLDSLRRRYSQPLYILLTLVGLILTIACANIANLLLARAAARRREMAVRLSIGAGRMRVIRQLLTESVVLASAGGALGILFAVWGIRALTLLLANGRENFTLGAELNWHVLAGVAALSLLTGVLFGLAPALQATRVDLMPALKEARTRQRHGRGVLQIGLSRILIVSQIAITLFILVAAGLFLRTLSNLESIRLGFNQENLLTFRLNARQAGHNRDVAALYEDLRGQFAAIPGVLSASLSNHSLIGDGTSMTTVSVPGSAPASTLLLTIGPRFFETMNVPILVGRGVDQRDRAGAPLAVVVNQAFVKRFFSGQNPLGRQVTLPRNGIGIEIVGLAADTLYGDLKGKVGPIIFLPYAQNVWGSPSSMVFELRTAGSPLGYVRAVREIVHRADDRIPLAAVRPQRAWTEQTINQEITFARLCTAFAALALVIACVGLYGTMSYSVARRTSEIGIRMALGAPRKKLVWMVLGEVIALALAGLAISVPGALVASKVVRSFLFGMKPNDPLSVGAAAVVLMSAAVLAGYLPARSASRVDPMAALRHE